MCISCNTFSFWKLLNNLNYNDCIGNNIFILGYIELILTIHVSLWHKTNINIEFIYKIYNIIY